MSTRSETNANPLARAAEAVPDGAGYALSIGARVAGAVASLYIAIDQSYDRTEALAAGAAVIALLTLVPLSPSASAWFSSLGAGVLFFGGSLLLSYEAGVVMLAAGAIGALAGLLQSHRSGNQPVAAVSAFFMGSAVTAAGVAVIILTIEG